jgi:tetratricopeptide (TPR) repeat protein
LSDDPVKNFLAALAGGSPQRLLLAGLPEELGTSIRRCALPHHFDEEILTVLCSDLGTSTEKIIGELVRMPIVNEDDSGLFIHETLRKAIFHDWLEGPDFELFKQLSHKLVETFRQREKQHSQDTSGSFIQNIIFHTFAYDESHAIQLFDALFRQEREQQRLGSCQLALEWAVEYGNYLGLPIRTQLNLYAGIIAGELRNWEQAIKAFSLVTQEVSAIADVQIKAAIGLAQAYAELQNFTQAFATCLQAYNQARERAASLVPDVLLSWGRILRDGGKLDQAEHLLAESARLADSTGDKRIAAGALNALGALYRKRNNPKKAVSTLQAAVRYLDSAKDNRLIATTKSNIGALLCDLNKWADAEAYLIEALDIYCSLADKRGEAMTLNNLLRVNLHKARYEEAIANATTASSLFVELRDYYAGAVARVNLAKILRKEGKEWKEPMTEAVSLFERANARSEAALHRNQLDLPPN